MSAQAIHEREDTALLRWLELLGWTVAIERDGARWTGVASRGARTGGRGIRVQRSATTERELVSKLFNGAMRGIALAA
jgi:hypothetical protein